MIRLRHHEIDKAKWDAGIARSVHPRIYAESWFLDVVSPGWEAIVSDDYTTLWPLTINRKFYWPVLVQPMFTQQLGLFSQEEPKKEETIILFRSNPYPILTLHSRSEIVWPGLAPVITKINSILPLQKDYIEIRKTFSKNCKRNLKKALQKPQTCHYHTNPDTFIGFIRQHNNYRHPEKHLLLLKQIISHALEESCGFILQVKDYSDKTLAMAFFLRKHKRITFLSGQSSQEGFQQQSMFLIMNQIIQNHAASDYILDFEGSSIEGIARFYKGFGAIPEPYHCYQHPLLSHTQKIRRCLNGALRR